jgi:hypothetical protein
MSITLQQRDDLVPLCPHCEQQLRSFFFRELSGFLGRRYVYFCGECKKCLGVSHRKGLFMG